jgi:hypothetical protein
MMVKKMKNKILVLLIVIVVLGLFFPGYGNPGQAENDEGIVFTWQDLQKLLDLKTDKIKLTWKEFRKLLEQGGNKIDMNFDIQGGIVTIKRERFKQILKNMKPVTRTLPAPPKDYLVTEAKYTGTAGEKNCRFVAHFKIYVFERESLKYTPVPLLSRDIAVSDISVDGVPGMMQIKGGWYNINLKKSGYHDVKVNFSAGKSKQSLSFPIIRAIKNTVDFSVPDKGFDIDIASALNVRRAGNGSSRVTAHFPPLNRMSVTWNPRSKQKLKKPALFYAHTHSLISTAQDILKVDTHIDLEVLQSSLDTISIQVPADYEVVRVTGQSIKNWQVRDTRIGRVLEIHFGFDIANRFQFSVHTERMLAADTLGVDFEGLKVIDARRETGAIGIVAESAVEVDVQPGPELEKLEFHQLPPKILAMSSRPVLYSYKYSRHPYHLDIAIHKHEQLEGISTVIESARGTALFLQEGKMLYKMDYTVRNSYKQFIELELPPNSSIWTVMVDNKREKASRNKKGKILIPLLRSSGNGDRLKSFNVRLIYTRPFEEFRLKGSSEYCFPKTDIFINKIRLEMFLPQGYSYNFDKGEWKEVAAAPVRRRKETGGRRADRDAFTDSITEKGDTSVPVLKAPEPGKKLVEEEKASKDELSEMDKGVAGGLEVRLGADIRGKSKKVGAVSLTGPVGLDSISVHLPLSGTKYLFSKKIIDKYETYPLKFSYIHKQALYVIYLLIALAIILLLLLSFFLYKRRKAR